MSYSKRKPKVGEIWIVDSVYTWGWCIVSINEIRGDILNCDVLDVEHKDRWDFVLEEQTKAKAYVLDWNFREYCFVRRLEK